MFVNFSYTRHQTPRGALPDAEVGNKLFLIKNVEEIRATYQIKMLTFIAHERGMKVVVKIPKDAKVHPSLRVFIKESNGLIKIERSS